MIKYKPLWETIKIKDKSTYVLIKEGVSKGTIHRLKHNLPVTTQTINSLCRLLRCTPNDIMVFESEEEEEKNKTMNEK